MLKTLIARAELKRILLESVCQYRGCETINSIELYELNDLRTNRNWDVGTIGIGDSEIEIARRAVADCYEQLAKIYDIVPA